MNELLSIDLLDPTHSEPSSNQQPPQQCNLDCNSTVLNIPKRNIPFGDLITTPKQKGSIRFFFNNINGIYKAKTWEPLQRMGKTMANLSIDIIGYAETNLKWNTRYESKARSVLQASFQNCNTTVSSNIEICNSIYQPGGTLTAITNSTTGHIKEKIVDPKSLGRWSGYSLSTSFGTNLHIITAYQSTKSDGIHTCYQQQLFFYNNKGYKNPDPRKLLLQDLSLLIQGYNDKGDTTVLMIDANDDLFAPKSLLPSFLSKTMLPPLIFNAAEHPATHTRGSKCIDFIFGSYKILDYITASGIMAFYKPPCQASDHRGMFVDVEQIALFGATIHTIPSKIKRKLYSTSYPNQEILVIY
jgi:hypothetical protein